MATRWPGRSDGPAIPLRSSLTVSEEAMEAVKLANTSPPRAIQNSATNRPVLPRATLSPYPTVLMVTTDQ